MRGSIGLDLMVIEQPLRLPSTITPTSSSFWSLVLRVTEQPLSLCTARCAATAYASLVLRVTEQPLHQRIRVSFEEYPSNHWAISLRDICAELHPSRFADDQATTELKQSDVALQKDYGLVW